MILSTTDAQGNIITADNNGKTAVLSLKLASESKSRKLGIIDIEKRTFEVKRVYSKHLFRKFNAYGFNHKILSETKLFDTIILSDDFNKWKFPVSLVLQKGKFLNFSKGGFELQVFIGLSELKDFEVENVF